MSKLENQVSPLFRKLQFKDHSHVLLVQMPDSFRAEAQMMGQFTQVLYTTDGLKEVHFALVFATEQAQIDQSLATLLPLLHGDVALWYAYPKAKSKRYSCNFNRDTGWDALGRAGFEGVRQVAIDEDWSALRFRKVKYIKQLTRSKSMAITPEGKKRTSGS